MLCMTSGPLHSGGSGGCPRVAVGQSYELATQGLVWVLYWVGGGGYPPAPAWDCGGLPGWQLESIRSFQLRE